MKRKISLLLIVTVLMTMAIPSVSLAETLGTSVVADNEYYYEDFESYTGASGWFDTASTNGYYSNAGDIFSNYSDAKNGTGLKIVNKTTSFNSFNGPRGNNGTYFDVSTEQFEDVGTTLVFTADVLIKDTLSVKGSGLYINLHALNGDWQNLNSTLHSVSALPMYTKHWSKGATFFVPINASGNANAGWTGGNATDFVTTTKVDGSTWVKLTSVVTYDKANQKYVTTSYVDGKPIYNETSKEISKLEVPAPSDDVAERTRFGISVNYRANNTDTSLDEYAVVDNLAMYLCDTAVPQSGTVSGKTITIPFNNGKTFTDENAPDVVTSGYLNLDTVSNAKLTDEDGNEIDGAVFNAKENVLTVTVPNSIGSDDKVKVDLTGVEDIAGNQVGLDTNEYTVSGAFNSVNDSYFQDFEGIANLSEAGYNPGNISASDTNKTFVFATTADKGNGLAVNYTAASSSKAVTAPDANATYGFSVDATAFETAGKELEYGYDVFIPGGAYKGESLAGYLLFKKADGTVIQYCSETPWLTNTDNNNPNLKIRAINDESVASDWTGNNNIYTANSKPGVDQASNSVYVDYAETEDGGWVSVKSRVSYVKDSDGTGYYTTKYYINGEVICNSDGSPAKFKIQENLVPENSERKYLQFSLYGNNGENNVNKIVVDNIFVNVVEAEEEEELPTPPNPPIQDADEELYYYEDFNSYTGASDWFNTGSTNGYNSNSGDIFSVYSDDKNGTSLKIVNKTTSFKGFSGPRGNADAYFDVSTAQFEDAGATLVFTADVLIKDSLSKDSSGLYINLHALKGDWQNLNSTLFSISALPMYTKHWQKGAMFFVPIQAAGNTQAGWTGGNATDYVTTNKTDGSSWVKLISVVNYDKANQKYVTTSYVDGKPIFNTNSGEISKLEVPAPYTDVATRTRLGVSVNYRANHTDTSLDEYAVVDNICIRMHNGITIDDYMQVQSNNSNISIPIYNGYQFEGENIPEYVKNAVIKNADAGIKKENILIEKFSQDDKLLLNGNIIEGYTGTLNDTVVDLSNVGERQEGENLRITLKGIEAVDGKGMLNSTVLVAADENFAGVIKSCFKDVNGENVLVSSADSVPTEVNKLELTLRGVNEAVITDGMETYTATDGVFDFATKPLNPNTTYTIKFDGSDYTTFKTVNSGTLTFSDISKESGVAKTRYVNTLNDDKTVYFTIMYFDSSNKLIKAVAEPKTAYKKSSNVMTMTIDSPIDGAYCKMMILDGFQTANPLSAMFVSPEQSDVQTSITAIKEIEITSFDNAKSATVKGALTEKTKQRITAVLLDAAGNLVYANDLYSANDGTYAFEINMPGTAETGTYRLYATASGRSLARGTEIHYSKDSSSSLTLVNDATTAEVMAQVIKDNQAALEFYYDEYYTSFNDSDKLAVAALILKEKNDLKTANGTGFITTDKQTAVKVFKKAVIVQAVARGMVTDYRDLSPHFDELLSGTVYNWLDDSGTQNIRSVLRSKWQSGVLNRLKEASFASFDDFLTKLRAALVFECIADSDGYENIRNILTDYVSQGYISGLNSTYITNSVCSNLVNKVYTGFEYTQLITDITTYYNTPSDTDKNNSSFGGGGIGGGIGGGAIFPGKTETPAPIVGSPTEDIINSENDIKYDTFRDISDCWAKDIIIELAQKNIISGIGDDFFAPERNITREEFAAIIVRMLGLSTVFEAELPFDDVSKDDWCYDVVKIAYQHGIINGKSVSEFGKGEYISRQDMAVMLKNALDVRNATYEEGILNFTDSAEILDYAHTAVKVLAGLKIINGYEDNTFKPSGLATRAEAAKVIYEVFKVLNV